MDIDPHARTVRLGGVWRLGTLPALERRLKRLRWPGSTTWTVSTAAITGLDTAGAWLIQDLLARLRRDGATVTLGDVPARHRALLELVGRAEHGERRRSRAPGLLERTGRRTVDGLAAALRFLSFVGDFTLQFWPYLARPWTLRWRQITAEIEKAGVAALPIVGLLAFLMGIVIAYQGGVPLDDYGANIYIIDLVTITMLREMAPLLTAIIIAGRTGSAYAAQLGTMRITEEVDALRTMGITPFEMLILPKFLALLVALPLLTLFADLLGLAGGMVIADQLFGVSYSLFLARIPLELAPSHFWLGMVKAPVFAALITLIGCYQGLKVSGSAEAVGRATTTSVVQSIFLVITTDAAFSILFSMAGL